MRTLEGEARAARNAARAKPVRASKVAVAMAAKRSKPLGGPPGGARVQVAAPRSAGGGKSAPASARGGASSSSSSSSSRGGAAAFVGDRSFSLPASESIRVSFAVKPPKAAQSEAPGAGAEAQGGRGRRRGGAGAALLKPGQPQPGTVVGAADASAAVPPRQEPGVRKL